MKEKINRRGRRDRRALPWQRKKTGHFIDMDSYFFSDPLGIDIRG
jgi:hypothetical protein